jgi:DNA ligase-associated metallophosphoesterase
MQSILSRVENKQACLLEFADKQFIADAIGTLFWPQQKTLVVSDLHLEKASFLAQHGNPIPRHDSRKTLNNLNEVITNYCPEILICLGDSFHDVGAWSRLSDQEREVLNTLIGTVKEWIWILGNHDPHIPEVLDGQQLKSLSLDGVLFCHEPELITTEKAQVFGHFHPKMQKKVARHQMTGRCFMYGETKMVMPAFGAYTGGLNIEDPVFEEYFDVRKAAKLQLYQDKIFAY